MASLFQHQEACEYDQPGSMHQQHHNGSSSVPLPAYTPPKRPAGDRSDDELADGLSPSPYKRPRSSRGALFHEPAAAAADAQHSRVMGARRGLGRPPRLPAADAAVRCLDRGLMAAGSGEEDDGEAEEHEGGSGEEQQHPAAAAAAAPGVPRWHTSSTSGGSSLSRFRRPAAAAAVGQHAGGEDGEAAAGDSHGDEDDNGDDDAAAAAAATAEGFRSLQAAAGGGDMGALLDGLGLTAPHGGLPRFQADPPARPSNASSYTGLRGHDAGAAAGGANFMSPPPRARGGRRHQRQGGSANTTPAKAGAGQQPPMGLLGSPMFERMMMAACATPPSAGHTQPSAATLAALQSPQPSRVHEPFWTPFTGLFQVRRCCCLL
jgi:hypothetical protein